jgi:plasmid maintenance system antidote protein VapI
MHGAVGLMDFNAITRAVRIQPVLWPIMVLVTAGKRRISADTALRLARYFRVSRPGAKAWLTIPGSGLA